MTTAPRVTIGLAVYNGGSILCEAIETLLSQEYTDFELIISDNASTDETQTLCHHYQTHDSRIRYYRNDKNIGASSNFRKVLQAAQGEFFMWAAHDDRWHPKFLLELVRIFDERPNVILAMHEVQYMLQDGTLLPFFPEGTAWNSGRLNQSSQLTRLLAMLQWNYGDLWYGLYRRSCLIYEKNGLNKTALDVYDEIDSSNELPLFLHVAARGEIAVTSDIRMWKRTFLPTFLQAAAERGYYFKEQDRPKLALGQRPCEDQIGPIARLQRWLDRQSNVIVRTAKYHWKTERAISAAVRRLPISVVDRLIVTVYMRYGLVRHFLTLILKYAFGKLK